MSDDRVVHARSSNGIELVRYDRAGRWWLEQASSNGMPPSRMRIKTVADAVEKALAMEAEGGEILLSKPGGRQFDSKVQGARAKRARHR